MKRSLVAALAIGLLGTMLSGCAAGKATSPVAVAPAISGTMLPPLAQPPAEAEPAVELGHYAPDFTLSTLDGDTISLSDLRGKVVLLNFWASWCAPCREEMPLLQAAHNAYSDGDLIVLGVNMGEETRRVVAFASDLALTFPVFPDEETSVGTLYRVRGAPTTYFIDREGIVRQRYVGPLTTGMLGTILSGERAYPTP